MIVNNKGADQTARMRRLVCAFVVAASNKVRVSPIDPCDVEARASWPLPCYAPAVMYKCTDRFFPLVWYNKLRMDHCVILGVTTK